MGSPGEQQSRIALWVTARCRSNAFLRAMVNRPGTKGLREPFSDAYHFGPERMSTRYLDTNPNPDSTYRAAKSRCERQYPSYDVVFVKEMAYYFAGRMEPSLKYLPSEFIHTFLIRDPEKTITSMYRMTTKSKEREWQKFLVDEVGYKEQHDMYRFVTEDLGQPAVVVDSDDLVQRPESVLRKYCETVGITFHEQMVSWSDEPQYLETFPKDSIWSEWYTNATKYGSFQTIPLEDKIDLPDHVSQAIEESRPFYNAMYAKRIILH